MASVDAERIRSICACDYLTPPNVFIIGQRFFVAGIRLGALKG